MNYQELFEKVKNGEEISFSDFCESMQLPFFSVETMNVQSLDFTGYLDDISELTSLSEIQLIENVLFWLRGKDFSRMSPFLDNEVEKVEKKISSKLKTWISVLYLNYYISLSKEKRSILFEYLKILLREMATENNFSNNILAFGNAVANEDLINLDATNFYDLFQILEVMVPFIEKTPLNFSLETNDVRLASEEIIANRWKFSDFKIFDDPSIIPDFWKEIIVLKGLNEGLEGLSPETLVEIFNWRRSQK